MSIYIFEQKMQAVQDRLSRLQRETSVLPPTQEQALSSLLEDLAVSLRELQVSSEELAATRQSLETQLKRAEVKPGEPPLKLVLREEEFGLRKVHQHLDTTFQCISNQLYRQVQQVDNGPIAERLLNCQDRIRMMARVHSKLCQSESLAEIDLADYIKRLLPDLFQMYANDSTIVKLNFAADDISLDASLAISCASIFCELVSNALRHAFPKNRKMGEMQVSLTAKANQALTLIVSDNGVGLPADLDIQRLSTMGLPLVDSLVKQLAGTMTIESSQGSTFEITFSTVAETSKN